MPDVQPDLFLVPEGDDLRLAARSTRHPAW